MDFNELDKDQRKIIGDKLRPKITWPDDWPGDTTRLFKPKEGRLKRYFKGIIENNPNSYKADAIKKLFYPSPKDKTANQIKIPSDKQEILKCLKSGGNAKKIETFFDRKTTPEYGETLFFIAVIFHHNINSDKDFENYITKALEQKSVEVELPKIPEYITEQPTETPETGNISGPLDMFDVLLISQIESEKENKFEKKSEPLIRRTHSAFSNAIDRLSGAQDRYMEEKPDEKQKKQDFLELTFERIVNEDELADSTVLNLRKIIRRSKTAEFYWYDRSCIVSALTLGLLRKFDEEKAKYLIDFIGVDDKNRERGVWQKALIGLILVMLSFDLDQIPSIKGSFDQMLSDENIQKAIEAIIESLYKGKFEIHCDEKLLENNYFSKNYRWFIPFHLNVSFYRKAIEQTNKNIDTSLFSQYLFNSPSLNNYDKYRVALKYAVLTDNQLTELIEIYRDEESEWTKLRKVFPDDVENQIIRNSINELYVFNNLHSKTYLGKFFQKKLPAVNLKSLDYVSVQIKKFEKLGDLYLSRYDTSKASEYYYRAKDFKGESSLLLRKIGYCNFSHNNFVEAIIYYEKALRINPEDSYSLAYLMQCYSLKNNHKKTFSCLNKLKKLKRLNAATIGALGAYFLVQDDYKEALTWLKKIEKLEPLKMVIKVTIWNCYYNLKDKKNESKYLNMINAVENQDFKTTHALGIVYVQRKSYQRALNYFLKTENLGGSGLLNPASVGWCYFKIGDFDNCRIYSLRALSQNGKNIVALEVLALCELCSGESEKALVYYKQCLELEENTNTFFKDYDEGYEHVKVHGISKSDYLNVKNKLKVFANT